MRCSAKLFACSRAVASVVILVVSVWTISSPVMGQGIPPVWAYPVNPPDFKPAPDTGIPRRVPDSSATYTVTQIRGLFTAPDWHPGDHPPMPEIVSHGRKPEVQACGVCHRAVTGRVVPRIRVSPVSLRAIL
jgi:hypothetical protein